MKYHQLQTFPKVTSKHFSLSKIALGIGLLAASQFSQATLKELPKSINLNANQPIAAKIEDNTIAKNYFGVDYQTKASAKVFRGDIRELEATKPWQPGDPVKVANPRHINNVANLLPPVNPIHPQAQRSVQSATQISKAPTDLVIDVNQVGFEFNGVNPPDPTGDIGENYYIHAANSGDGAQVQIFNKDGSAATQVFSMDNLATDSDCQSGLGDPIVIYDEQAKRWLLTEFSSSGNKMCVYVSQTSDPITGGWFAYAFQAPGFPDYPKYSVWGDAYYISANESGGAVYALDRSQMLQGGTVSLIRQTIPRLNGFGFQSITPVDVDGSNQPEAASPGLFIRHRDDELHNAGANDGTKDFLEIWKFTPDFDNANNSTLEGPINIEIGEFDSNFNCSDQHFGCLEQKDDGSGLSTLDPLREVVNYKAQYRNFLSHQSITGTFVSKRGDNSAELRWFELRLDSGNWILYDEGTDSANDANSRFMAGSALDGDGNMAVAYMSTGADRFPGVRLTGRRSTDPLGGIDEEIAIVDADGGIASDRAGDYSQMSVDPLDNCTFWFTAEQGGTGGMWKTRVASFKYDDCTGTGSTDPGFNLASTNRTQEVCVAGQLQPINLTVNGYNNFADTVSFSYTSLPSGLSGTFSANPVAAGGSTNAIVTVEQGTADGQYQFTIGADSGSLDQRSVDASVQVVDATHLATLIEPLNGAESVDTMPTFSWEVDGYVSNITIQIATDQSFQNIVAEGVISSGTSYRPSAQLAQETLYFWRAVANNVCGSETSEVRQFTTRSDKDISTELVSAEAIIISGEEDSTENFYIDVPANTASLVISTSGGNAGDDLDIYMSKDALPESNSDIICASLSASSTESCTIEEPEQATYFVLAYGYSAYSNVSLVANLVSRIPSIESQSVLSVDEDSSITLDANDFDIVDGDSTSFTLSLSDGENYSLDGTTITPDANFNGTLSISVTASDGEFNSEAFIATITVNPVNDAPAASTDSFTVAQDSQQNMFDVLENDSDVDSGDTLTISSLSYTGTGSATISGNQISYTPKSGESGSDQLSYTVIDSAGATAIANVSITITPKPKSGGGSNTLATLLFLTLLTLRKKCFSKTEIKS